MQLLQNSSFAESLSFLESLSFHGLSRWRWLRGGGRASALRLRFLFWRWFGHVDTGLLKLLVESLLCPVDLGLQVEAAVLAVDIEEILVLLHPNRGNSFV